MRMQSTNKRLLGTSSALVLSAAAMLSAGQPANAQTAANGIYMGGSTLASEAFRQVLDCYTGTAVANDGFASVLPSNCTVVSTVQGMYAGVGSGNGIRGFIANAPAQWYGGTVTAGTTIPLTPGTTNFVQPPFPALQPPFVDSGNSTNFGTYPYPHVDIGLSDSPLAATLAALTTVSSSFTPSTGWAGNALVTTTQVVVGSTTQVATYSTTAYGQPIQIPAFEVNVAIPINVSGLTINSQIKDTSGNIVQGGAIQLTEAQLCAIFSGRVSNWNDTSTDIPDLDSSGNAVTAKFSDANVGNGVSTGQAYSAGSLPIKVVFRSDGSGTSFILTNYLKTVCPLLDKNGIANYATIFGASNLPSTTFANLITNIGNTAITNNWVGASGSGGVASAINGDTGRIGYVSSDFTKPYATSSTAPVAASLQNEDLRSNGVTQPNPVSTTTLTFIAPTPDSASAAWADLPAPQSTWTWNDYNVYAQTYTTGSKGGISLAGKPILALAGQPGAYPLSGTTFLDLYSCYNGSTRVANLRNFLTWYLNGADSTAPGFDPHVSQIVESSGFHLLPATYTGVIVSQYLTAGTNAQKPKFITAAASTLPQPNGCAGVLGGANGGAK
jgi:phosphate transport system substrate-binding protein